MTAPKFLYQITKEFKDQTNKRFSNLATTIKITKIHLMSYNNEKWSHATVNSSDVRSDRRARSWTTTVHDTKDGKLSADDCTRQQTCSGKRLSTKQDGFETAHQNARRKTNSDLTAPRRLTATINDQRQHSPMTNKRL